MDPGFSIGCFLAHAKDWHDFGPSSETRRWPSNGHNPDPWHRGPPASLRGILPNGDSPSMVKVDLAHTYAIAGWGKDMLASMLVFLANRCKAWGGTNIDVQLDAAYDSFFDWCVANKKDIHYQIVLQRGTQDLLDPSHQQCTIYLISHLLEIGLCFI